MTPWGIMNKRALILSASVVVCFFLVIVRLVDLMLLSHERLSERARLQQERQKEILAYRGVIYDRRGRELAINLDTDSLYVNPGDVGSPEKTARLLAEKTGEDYAGIMRKVSTGGGKGFIWVKRKLDRETSGELKKLTLPGVGFMPEVKRYYPKGRLASHVIGFVGVDNQPLGGVELSYEEVLKGKTGKVAVSRDAGGRTLSEGLEFQSTGNSVVLTVDEGLQYVLERGLDRAIELWNAASASAMMMDPYTGEILAMANRPNYDPNSPALTETAGRRNRALTDTYEPGSTFKIVMAAGALEEGIVDEETKVDCSALRVGKMKIEDVHMHGVMTFREIIKTSSNIGSVKIAQRLGNRLYNYAKRLGFGEATGIDLPGEAKGRILQPGAWSGTTLPAMTMGYEVGVTPLQVLRAYSAIANGGFLVRPHVVASVISPEGDVIYRFEPSRPKQAISQRTSERLREILIGVTQKGGTATGASIEGNTVAGKTGTSKLLQGGKYSKKYVASFVGFVPADNPRVALVVVVREPRGQYYGGVVAAPLFKEIAEQTLTYLNVPREDTWKDNVLVVGAGARSRFNGYGKGSISENN